MTDQRIEPFNIGSSSAGHIFQMVREGSVSSRADIARATGLARSTVSQRVEALLALGLLNEDDEAFSTGGRPPTRLSFNSSSGVTVAADFGATHCRLAVTDLGGMILAEEAADLAIAEGPEKVLGWAQDRFDVLLKRAERPHADVRGIGIGVPGPVEFAAGRAISPPIMPGWDGVSIPDRLAQQFPGVPVLVDNDVNIMALGEYWAGWRNTVSDLMFVKVGTGIGAGLVMDGRLHRGAQGAAGDMGHIRGADESGVICSCGNEGCVEAIASGWALARKLTNMGFPAAGARDVVAMVRSGNQEASLLVRDAGRSLGIVVAEAVNLLNPAVVVIGGDLAAAETQLFAGIREVVYRRSTTLSTGQLQIVRSRLGERAGVTGAAVTVLNEVLSPEAIDAAIAQEVA